jgi:hypothetical protein
MRAKTSPLFSSAIVLLLLGLSAAHAHADCWSNAEFPPDGTSIEFTDCPIGDSEIRFAWGYTKLAEGVFDPILVQTCRSGVCAGYSVLVGYDESGNEVCRVDVSQPYVTCPSSPVYVMYAAIREP